MGGVSRVKDYMYASRTRVAASAFVVLIALMGGVYLVTKPKAASPATAKLTIASQSDRAMAYEIGYDHTQASHIFENGNSAAASRAQTLLSSLNAPQNVHIMGFGVDNPE